MFAVFVLTAFSLTVLSQTQEELTRDFGEPKKGYYSLEPGIISKIKFDKNGQAKNIGIVLDKKNIFGHKPLQFISVETTKKLIEYFTSKQQKQIGKRITGMNYGAGCTFIRSRVYENVQISKAVLCYPKKDSITSIYIFWSKWDPSKNKKVKPLKFTKKKK